MSVLSAAESAEYIPTWALGIHRVEFISLLGGVVAPGSELWEVYTQEVAGQGFEHA